MKKIFILIVCVLINFAGFAQRIKYVQAQPASFFDPNGLLSATGSPLARTTAVGDTETLRNTDPADSLRLFTVDSGGYTAGTNFWGDKAFAERYDINGLDSSVHVLGVMALFGGKINAASTRTISFNIWGQSGQQFISGNSLYNGFPNTIVDSFIVPVTQLGINPVKDTLKTFMFAVPSPLLSGSFFAGYSINYSFISLDGDTLALASSLNGERHPLGSSGLYTVDTNIYAGVDTTVDTVFNVQNATLGADNVWYDNYTQNDSLKNNLAIYPIVAIGHPNGVSSLTKNSLSFFGNYPNPALDYTNIRFALAQGADVTITVMDMAGHIAQTIHQAGLAAGDHTVTLNTSAMPAGDYLYLVRTSAGDGVAGKMSKLP